MNLSPEDEVEFLRIEARLRDGELSRADRERLSGLIFAVVSEKKPRRGARSRVLPIIWFALDVALRDGIPKARLSAAAESWTISAPRAKKWESIGREEALKFRAGRNDAIVSRMIEFHRGKWLRNSR